MKTTTIHQKIVILQATPEQVYDALLDSDTHEAMTGNPAKIANRVGGLFTAWDGYISGRNLELDRGKRIVQEWVTTEWPKGYPPSRLEITLKKTERGTEITVAHSEVPEKDAADYEQGWHDFYWGPMKEYFKE